MDTHTIAKATAQGKPISVDDVLLERTSKLLDWLEFIGAEIRLHTDREGVYPNYLHQSRVRVRGELLKRTEGS